MPLTTVSKTEILLLEEQVLSIYLAMYFKE